MTVSSNAALSHLKAIKPNDGWSIKRDKNGLRLYRRNVALTDNSFVDIHYCLENKVVVGLLTKAATTCQVLVTQTGQPTSSVRRFVSCKDTYDPNDNSNNNNDNDNNNISPATITTSNNTADRFTQHRRVHQSSNTTSANHNTTLSPEDNQMILRYGVMVVLASIVLRAMSSSMVLVIYFVGLPLVYVYALQTCPPASTFDAKKELKRVLRGHHLPQGHPEKPKGFLAEMATRVAASVTTELATMPGYQVSMLPFGGAVILVDLVIPTANTQHYWLGAFGKWHYVYSRKYQSS
ncbi:unnamed protein product [Cylindrotheca closterium]|uniref:Uncharacterized protein n=1 Tax=Cylindrotheca closterium TaxID=2856 RepID=A0AAD2CNU7_9STRA|nr:unnamed protein product [Cylindrotheca closterium]